MDKETKEKQEQQQHQQQTPLEKLQKPNKWSIAMNLEVGKPIGLELDFSSEGVTGTGIRVSRVNPGMAMGLGVLQGDLLTSVGGKDIRKTNVAAIRKMLHDPCHSTELVFQRGLQDEEGDSRVDVGAGKEARPSSPLQKHDTQEAPSSTNKGAGSVSDKPASLKRPREESGGDEDAAAHEVTQAAREKKPTRVTGILYDETRGAAVGIRHTVDEPRAAIERQRQRDHENEQEMARKPEKVKQKEKQGHPPMTKKWLEWKADNSKNVDKAPKIVASVPPLRSQASASEAAKQPLGFGKRGKDVEKMGQKKTASAAGEASSLPWLGQLISLELGGIAGTNSARAAVMMNEVREMVAEELATLQEAGKLSQHLTRAEYAAFRGRDLHCSAGYVTLKGLSDQYLVDHEDELAEIAETDFVPDLLGSALEESVPPPAAAAAAAATAPRELVNDGERRSEVSAHPVGRSSGLEIARKTPGRVKFVLRSHELVQAVVLRALACHQQAVATANTHRMIRKQSLLDVRDARKESKKTERQAEIVISKIRGWQKAAHVGEEMAVDLSSLVTQRAEMLRDAVEFLMSGLEMQKVMIERLGVFHMLREQKAKREKAVTGNG